jgi:hypothetical protein
VLRFEVEDVEAFVAERQGRGKHDQALAPALPEPSGTLLPFASDSSRSSRRGTTKTDRSKTDE